MVYVHIIAPYVKIITCIHSLRHLTIYKYKTKQLITAVRTFLKIKVQLVTILPHGIMGNGITLVFIMGISIRSMCSDFTATKLALGFLSITLHFSNPWLKTVHPFTFFET